MDPSTKPVLETLHMHIKNDQNVGSDTIKQLYDNWVKTYDEDYKNYEYMGPAKVSTIFAEHCHNKDAAILDCGAGTGLVGKELSTLGFTNITGLDLSQKALDAAGEKNVYKKLVCAEVGKKIMPFKDDEFDGLICCGCMLPSHMSPNCFRDWARVVKPGGTITLVMRRCYAELVKGEEEFLIDWFKKEFDTVIDELNEGKRWQSSKIYFADYIEHSAGLALVAKVL